MSLLLDPHTQLLSDEKAAKLFNYLLLVSQIAGGGAVLATVVWMGGYGGGYAWQSNPDLEFSYHPTCMLMGMVFLYGEALLVYRVFRHEKKRVVKLAHVALHSAALLFMLVALKAAWDSHDLHKSPQGELDPLPNLVSLHSWIGLTVAIAYAAQYVLGFMAFFAPGFSLPVRQLIMPFHQLAGLTIFLGVGLAVSVGISERAAWKHTCWTKDKQMCGQQVTANIAGVGTLIYIGCVCVLTANPRWRRRPLPEEESLHQLNAYAD